MFWLLESSITVDMAWVSTVVVSDFDRGGATGVNCFLLEQNDWCSISRKKMLLRNP